jgi:transposase-like protein
VYEGCDYPHRVFQLDVVLAAVLMALDGGTTFARVAQVHQCCRDSVRRWLRWVESLADPRDLERLCSRLDPDGLPPPSATVSGRAAKVIVLLERLVDLLSSRGVDLPAGGAGLVRLLLERLRRFGEVFYLTKSSPPLRADLSQLCL